MLKEKVDTLHANFAPLQLTYEAILAMKPAKIAVEEACEKLKPFIAAGTSAAVDPEVRTAIVSVYNTLEVASKGLNDPSVVALFL